MKIFPTLLLIGGAMAGGFPACADTLFFSNNQTANGIILRTNANDLLVLNDSGTVNWPRASITKVVTERADTRMAGTANELPNFKNILLLLNAQPWAAKLQQIPATVIDQGVMKNVPYLSFRCGDDYEVNVYGDLDHPAAVEAGVYRKLLENTTARSNCLNFIYALLNQDADRMAVRQLDWEGAATNHGERTLEITPPTAVDAYGGWWVSAYSTARLDTMRASDAELIEISTGKSDVNSNKESASWTAKELEFARPTRPSTITVKTSFGDVITNAEIVRVNEGVSLVWKSGGAGGVAKLADLPEDIRNLFGYDEAKVAAAEIAEREKRMQQTAQDQRALQQAQANAAESAVRLQAARQEAASYRGGYTPAYSGGSSSYLPLLKTIKVAAYTQRAARGAAEPIDTYVLDLAFEREAVVDFPANESDILAFCAKQGGRFDLTSNFLLRRIEPPAWLQPEDVRNCL